MLKKTNTVLMIIVIIGTEREQDWIILFTY